MVAGSGVSEAELLEALRDIKARRLLLFFNACHSGEISPTLGVEETQTLDSLSLPETTTDALLSSGEGRIIVTACRSEQKSWIGSGPLTLFGRALVDGLSGRGVVGNHGYISAYSLYESIFQLVSEAAQQLGKVQEPELTVLKGVGPFPVALYRGASSLGNFDANEELPPGMATRAVNPARSRRYFEQMIRNISASSQGVAVGGDVKDSVINTGTNNAPLYIVKGGIHAGRDVVQGDQFNYMGNVASPQNQDEFISALTALQAQIAELKRQPDLTMVQQVNIQAAEQKIAEAAREAKKQNPAGASIRSMLAEARGVHGCAL